MKNFYQDLNVKDIDNLYMSKFKEEIFLMRYKKLRTWFLSGHILGQKNIKNRSRKPLGRRY